MRQRAVWVAMALDQSSCAVDLLEASSRAGAATSAPSSAGRSPLASGPELYPNGHDEDDAARQFVTALMDPNGMVAGLEEFVRRPKWQERSACRNEDTSTFFPVDGVGLAVARRICARCPVISECRAFACADSSLKGIWAGMSERERARERQRARAQPPSSFPRASRADELSAASAAR